MTDPEGPFQIVEVHENDTHSRVYIHVKYKTLELALNERAGLLRFFSFKNPWRVSLCVRDANGQLYNPDVSTEGRLP